MFVLLKKTLIDPLSQNDLKNRSTKVHPTTLLCINPRQKGYISVEIYFDITYIKLIQGYQPTQLILRSISWAALNKCGPTGAT